MKPKQKDQFPFFVYGTLLPGQPNAYLWHGEQEQVAAATLANGRLYDMGNYPMLVEETGPVVHGVLITVADHHYRLVRQRIDSLEGYDPARPDAPGYRRVRRRVKTENGRWRAAWVYVGRKAYVAGKTAVPHGNWAAYVASKMNQLEKWWSDIDTVYGLHDTDSDHPDGCLST